MSEEQNAPGARGGDAEWEPAGSAGRAHVPHVLDPAAMREQYRAEGIDAEGLAAGPMEQFGRWFAEAVAAGIYEPNAMVVSTADARGRPSSRTVLLKQYAARGFVFYTNHTSRKGREIAENPHVALLFPWHPMARQVLVTGTAAHLDRAETAAYFHSRPHGSQLGAWASDQSRTVASREVLDEQYARLAARYPEGSEVPVPPHWGGYLVTPETVEFWQGRENRLHDRLRYRRAGGEPGTEPEWMLERLSP
ncbi:pyridoxamine 5'-phosphate oxidase [Streptomyces sp. SID11385]|nr:pyridoxamine 5'-phosphate oxidase [Streptomyces sp. SID11385]